MVYGLGSDITSKLKEVVGMHQSVGDGDEQVRHIEQTSELQHKALRDISEKFKSTRDAMPCQSPSRSSSTCSGATTR